MWFGITASQSFESYQLCATRICSAQLPSRGLNSNIAVSASGPETIRRSKPLVSRLCNITSVDGVYNAFKDEDGLRAECTEGRDMGFDGKTLIHPAQLGIANEVFAPSPEVIDLARRQIAAFDAAMAAGQGVAVVDGRIVENLHIVTARATLAQAEAIAAMEG